MRTVKINKLYSIQKVQLFCRHILKGQSNEIFDLHVFLYSNLPVIQILDLKNDSTGVQYSIIPGEIDSPGYHFPGSHVLADFL